ncbi:MAG: hypothetical protein ABFS86_17640, partial [Planctomycetota bacterium]
MKTVTLAVALALTLTGCLIISSDKTETEGTEVGVETLKQIVPGTSEEEVLTLLGPPTSRKPVSEGAELLRWEYRRTRSQGTVVFLLFAGTCQTSESGTIYVTMKDKQVERI